MRRGQRRWGLPPGCRRGSGGARRGGSHVLRQRPRCQRCPRKRRCPSSRRPLPARHGATAAASGGTTRQHRAYPAPASRPPTRGSAWAARAWAARRSSGLSPCGGGQPLAAAWGRRGRSRLRRRPQTGSPRPTVGDSAFAAAACTGERRFLLAAPPRPQPPRRARPSGGRPRLAPLLCRAAARPTRGTGGGAPAPPPPPPPPTLRPLRPLRPLRYLCPLHPQRRLRPLRPLRPLQPGPSRPPPLHALARLRATQAKRASPSPSKARLRPNPRARRHSSAARAP